MLPDAELISCRQLVENLQEVKLQPTGRGPLQLMPITNPSRPITGLWRTVQKNAVACEPL